LEVVGEGGGEGRLTGAIAGHAEVGRDWAPTAVGVPIRAADARRGVIRP
jgi:hypothetical protein